MNPLRSKRPEVGPALLIMGLGALFVVAVVSQAETQISRRDWIIQREGKSGAKTSGQPYVRRGEIVTSDGKVVAQNENSYNVSLSYSMCPATPGFYMDLSKASGIPFAELNSPMPKVNYRLWSRDLSASQIDELKRVRKQWQADGLVIQPVEQRAYPMGEEFSGVVGIVRGGNSISGLEKSLDDQLSGKAGLGTAPKPVGLHTASYETDSSGPQAPGFGKNVTLTIDSTLQSAAFEAVRNAVVKFKAKTGSAVVIDPKTGDILALANWPAYDPNENLDPKSLSSSSYQSSLEPGSMFKILTLAEALQTHAIQPGWTMYCSGVMDVDGKHSIQCDDHKAHGQVDITRAIAMSCNLSAATWASKIGRPVMTDYLQKLGLVGKPEVELPYAAAGSYPKADTSRLMLANLGFGQAMQSSPVALASAFSMLGNHGLLMKPRLIRTEDGVEIPTESKGQILRPDVTDTVLHCMEAVMDEGTASKLPRIPGVQLAGKTGTAQKFVNGKVMGYVSNFVGFVPATNPRACVVVMIDSPDKSKGYHGADVAGPAFIDIAKSIVRKQEVDVDTVPAIKLADLKPAPAAKNEPDVELLEASYRPQDQGSTAKATDIKPSEKAKDKKQQEEEMVVNAMKSLKTKKKVVDPDGNLPGKFDSEVPRDEVATKTQKLASKKTVLGATSVSILNPQRVARKPKPIRKVIVPANPTNVIKAQKHPGTVQASVGTSTDTMIDPLRIVRPAKKTKKQPAFDRQSALLFDQIAGPKPAARRRKVTPAVTSSTEQVIAPERIVVKRPAAPKKVRRVTIGVGTESVVMTSPQRVKRAKPAPVSAKMGAIHRTRTGGTLAQ